MNTVATMCERGHADKMVLSHDASCFIDWLPEELVPVAMPNWHYLHISDDVLPALKERGVTDEQITHDAGRQPAHDLRRTGRLLMPERHRSDRHPGRGAGGSRSRCTRGHLLGPHTHPPRTRSVHEPAGARVRRARSRRRRLRDDRAAQLDPVGGFGAGRVEARRDTAAAFGAAARRRARGPAGPAVAGADRRPRRPARKDPECASGFHPGSGVVGRRTARGGVTGVEVDGVGRQHGTTQADRGGRRQPVSAEGRVSARRAGRRRQPDLGSAVATTRASPRSPSVSCRVTTWC